MIYSSMFYDEHKDYDVRLGIVRQTYGILLECLRKKQGLWYTYISKCKTKTKVIHALEEVPRKIQE